jgi:hypothetical protein
MSIIIGRLLTAERDVDIRVGLPVDVGLRFGETTSPGRDRSCRGSCEKDTQCCNVLSCVHEYLFAQAAHDARGVLCLGLGPRHSLRI